MFQNLKPLQVKSCLDKCWFHSKLSTWLIHWSCWNWFWSLTYIFVGEELSLWCDAMTPLLAVTQEGLLLVSFLWPFFLLLIIVTQITTLKVDPVSVEVGTSFVNGRPRSLWRPLSCTVFLLRQDLLAVTFTMVLYIPTVFSWLKMVSLCQTAPCVLC